MFGELIVKSKGLQRFSVGQCKLPAYCKREDREEMEHCGSPDTLQEDARMLSQAANAAQQTTRLGGV